MYSCFASCSKGLESLLYQEVSAFGSEQIKETVNGVSFQASIEVLYRCCLWSRFASRIFLVLEHAPVKTISDLYSVARQVAWDAHFLPEQSFLVDFSGTNRDVTHTQFGAMKIKDAVADFFQDKYGYRPNVDKNDPQWRIHARLHRGYLTLSIDLVGRALHERGWRKNAGRAPLKENLACAVLARSTWQVEQPLLDPMCGSGTLVIEAAMQAANIAPGLHRGFLFENWREHQVEVWHTLKEQALKQIKEPESSPRFFARDMDARILKEARQHAIDAGVADWIVFEQQNIQDLAVPEDFTKGVIVVNPPYAERLSTPVEAICLYYELGQQLKQKFSFVRCAVLCSDPMLLSCLRVRADKKYPLFNGALACELRCFSLPEKRPQQDLQVAQDFANRLQKNVKKNNKWLASEEDLDAYRLYDADLPDYNMAIDRYGPWLVVQEYAPPKEVPTTKSQQRLYDALYQCVHVLQQDPSQVIVKIRQRQRGHEQYEVTQHAQKNGFVVHEYGTRFYVNLMDYIDTGLFLDHRWVRRFIQQHAQGKRFLNLFCYTGSATVHAALGGAKRTVSVDLSKTYLDWAKQNMQLNMQLGRNHQFIQDDCMQWVKYCRDQFDLVLLDPPTFSNSKRMKEHFVIQEQYLTLLENIHPVLVQEGMLIFSTNQRGFKFDIDAVQSLGFDVEDVTQESIPFDFKGKRPIHWCWLLTKA